MLVVRVYINSEQILGGYAIRIKGNTKPNNINTYRLHDGTTIKHRYGDGASKLAQKILKRMKR